MAPIEPQGRPRLADRAAPASGGFTLIALLTTLAVLGIAVAVTYGGLGRASGRYALVAEARRVHARLAEVRARTIAEQREHRVQVVGGRLLAVSRREGSAWRTAGSPLRLPAHLELRMSGGAGATLDFRPPGRVAVPRTIVVQGPGERRTMQVLASGMIRWVDR